MHTLDAAAVAERFGLGTPVRPPERAAVGWGGHNTVWRLQTEDGDWAIKQLRRKLVPAAEQGAGIEQAAYDLGIPAARPVPSRHGPYWATLAGTPVRCHEWVAGQAKTNEQADSDDASRMGRIAAQLHGLRLPATPTTDTAQARVRQWLRLAGESHQRWAVLVRESFNDLVAVEAQLEERERSMSPGAVAGGHRDMNAHNVLFNDDRLVLIDWDAAGPASVPFERATYPVLWAKTDDGRYDLDTATAFISGYRDADGTVTSDDAEFIWTWLHNLITWTEQNIELALQLTTPDQDRLTGYLLKAVLTGPSTVREMQAVFNAAATTLH